MKILIPTRGYNPHQISYRVLKSCGLKPTLVIDPDEDKKFYKDFQFVQRTDKKKGIAAARQFCMDNYGIHVQVDDDLKFHRVHRTQKGFLISKSFPMESEELKKLFRNVLPDLLSRYAHGGVHQRFFAHAAAASNYPVAISGPKYRSLLAYNPKLFKRPVEFKGTTGEDHSVLIQLAQQGLDWFCITSFAISEKEFTKKERWTEQQKKKDYAALMATLPERHLRRSALGHMVYRPKRILADAKEKS